MKKYNDEFNPILKETNEKIVLKEVLVEFNIKNIISIYDCPEFDYLKSYLNDLNINFFYLFHFIDTQIYNILQFENINKKNDILFYGWANKNIYKFRSRLLDITKNIFNLHQIKRDLKYNPKIVIMG